MVKFVESTARVEKLLNSLKDRGFSDRSSEWIRDEELEDVSVGRENEPVIVRKAYAIREILTKMTDPKVNAHTHTYEIEDGELIVGTMPLGSNGLGKVFPNYLTEDEKRAASYTNKTELAVLGHNTINYERLLSGGLKEIIHFAEEKLAMLNEKIGLKKNSQELVEIIPVMQFTPNAEALKRKNELLEKRDFYIAVIISCNAVVEYANKFSELAHNEAERYKYRNAKHYEELKAIEEICKKVPYEKPDTFYEALQSIYFFHVALHASMNYISLGRLDQVLIPFYEADIAKCTTEEEKQAYKEKVIELLECFIIKGASRLNLTTEYLLEQDHMDNNAALGVHPYYLDQREGVNNFLQNIIVGGTDPEGEQADNEITYSILNAYANVNLSTPGIYVRMGSNSSKDLKDAVAMCLDKTKNLPGILNDDVLIPALFNDLSECETTEEGREKVRRLVNDYCVDGCWEPILNGESDWTFGMISCMNVYQCAINGGAVLDTNIGMLRGSKVSYRSKQVTTYDEMQESFKKYMQFFIDQATFGFYDCYTMDEFITPSPLFSALHGQCLERGRDKAWAGSGFNICGVVLTGVPDVINNIAALKKFVFDEEKYTLKDVKEAMLNNFQAPLKADVVRAERWKEMRHDFDYNCPKFGDASEEIAEIGNFVMNAITESVKKSKEYTDRVFLKSMKGLSDDEKNEIRHLRKIAGYTGSCFQRKFGEDFNMRFTAGCGTFEGYPQQGSGVVATANRNTGDPLIANFSPAPGTIKNGLANVFRTLGQLPMNKMSAGAITDLCINEKNVTLDDIYMIIDSFISNQGCMMTLAFGDVDVFNRIYELSYNLVYGDEAQREFSLRELPKYRDIVVRVGGWQAPFVSMSLAQQKNYILRLVDSAK